MNKLKVYLHRIFAAFLGESLEDRLAHIYQTDKSAEQRKDKKLYHPTNLRVVVLETSLLGVEMPPHQRRNLINQLQWIFQSDLTTIDGLSDSWKFLKPDENGGTADVATYNSSVRFSTIELFGRTVTRIFQELLAIYVAAGNHSNDNGIDLLFYEVDPDDQTVTAAWKFVSAHVTEFSGVGGAKFDRTGSEHDYSTVSYHILPRKVLTGEEIMRAAIRVHDEMEDNEVLTTAEWLGQNISMRHLTRT